MVYSGHPQQEEYGMEEEIFNYQLQDDTLIFTDALKKDGPYIARAPRNHESLFIVTKGALLYERDGERHVVEKGQVGYIARGSIDKSSAYLCDEVSYIAANFRFDRESAAPVRTLPFHMLCSQGNAYNYEKLFSRACNCFLSKAPGYILVCNGIMLQIIGQLYSEHKTEHEDFIKNRRIEKAVQYLRENYGDPDFKINQLSELANMSEKHFRRLFFDLYRRTPYAFLQEFRIDRAEILLSNTEKSIADIALQCGFSDIYSFSHSFKTHTGLSPSKYREQSK